MNGCAPQVFKPAEDTPLSALAFAEILQEAGLPDGAFTVVLGTGSVGAQLCQHPDIAKVPLGDRGVGSKGGKGGGGLDGEPQPKALARLQVSFTGSMPTGRKVNRACADSFKRVRYRPSGYRDRAGR